MKKSILLPMAIVLAAAGSAPAIAGNVKGQVPAAVGCDALGECYANFSGDNFGPAGCESKQIRWDGTATYGKNLTANILTAKAGGLTVKIGFQDACVDGKIAINYVTLE